MAFSFLSPVSETALAHSKLVARNAIGQKISIHSSLTGFPDLKGVHIALIGILENRGNESSSYQIADFDGIRKEFYELFPGNWSVELADLGDIQAGETLKDTFYAVKQVTAELLRDKIVPVFIGGSQDLMYPIYRSFDELESMVNVVNIDSRFDLGDINSPINSRNYVGKMVAEEPYNLFNYTNLGYQTFFNSQEEIELLDKMFFEFIRLGELTTDIKIAEPALRDADMVGIDLSVVKASEIAFAKAHPNGLTGKQICTLSRYSGISDRTKVFGIFENSKKNIVTCSQLVSQVIWYFIEGFNYRSNEYPFSLNNELTKYRVPVDDEILTFYKSMKTNRWWIELPFFTGINNKLTQHTLLPCNRSEYEMAIQQKLPERWLRARRKNEI